MTRLDHALHLLGDYRGLKMCELGNQRLHLNSGEWNVPAKPYFEVEGIEHVSLDLNGLDGALKVDLSKPITDPAMLGRFDVVTNFGTAEHVLDYYQCLANMHSLCRVGGMIVSVGPASGSWAKHGLHYVTEKTFEKLSELTEYRIIGIERQPCMWNVVDGWEIHATLSKTAAPFPDRESFSAVPVFQS